MSINVQINCDDDGDDTSSSQLSNAHDEPGAGLNILYVKSHLFTIH